MGTADAGPIFIAVYFLGNTVIPIFSQRPFMFQTFGKRCHNLIDVQLVPAYLSNVGQSAKPPSQLFAGLLYCQIFGGNQ